MAWRLGLCVSSKPRMSPGRRSQRNFLRALMSSENRKRFRSGCACLRHALSTGSSSKCASKASSSGRAERSCPLAAVRCKPCAYALVRRPPGRSWRPRCRPWLRRCGEATGVDAPARTLIDLNTGEWIVTNRRRAILMTVLTAGLLSFWCDGQPRAQDVPANSWLATVLKRGYIKWGIIPDNPPFALVDDKGQYAGFDVEIARIVATAMFEDPSIGRAHV